MDYPNTIWNTLTSLAQDIVILGLGLGLIALVIRRTSWFPAIKQTWPESRLNLTYGLIDAVAVVPLLILLTAAMRRMMVSLDVTAVDPAWVAAQPAWAVGLVTLAVSDFVGYWRHRLMHTKHLWPIHAAHHSDRNLTFLSLLRFHPLNRLMAVVADTLVLLTLGAPAWAAALSGTIRHYHGYLVHANLKWTFGPLGKVLVSPVFHRWHHTRSGPGQNRNFATIFSLYDRIFGTAYDVGAKQPDALGVDMPDYPSGWAGQLLYPIMAWAGRRSNS